MLLSQAQRIATVTTPLGPEVLVLYRMTGNEQLSHLFEYDLELLSEKNAVDLKQLLGKTMTIKLSLAGRGQRYFHGIVTRASQTGMLGRLYAYRATLHPKPWLLTRTSNCRIQSDRTVPEIVKDILGKHGYTDLQLQLNGSYARREYCVQYRETDFNFISRLMEEEGIYYYFKHGESQHTMVLCDAMAAHTYTPGHAKISYFPPGNEDRREQEHFYEWKLNQEIQSGSYVLDDFDFQAPKKDLTAKSSLPNNHAEDKKEVYDYPGLYLQNSEGNQYARVRMEELHAGFELITAVGNTRYLATGSKFTLENFSRTDQNRDYLAVFSRISLQNNGYESYGIADGLEDFQCQYSLLSTEYNFRPPRVSRIPVVHGVQTAIVVGKAGEEIDVDKYGRVKVQFHWDREGKNDENSSCWVRVAQIWAGKNWGAMHIPRIGQEVIVDFLEGNPDRPIITGRVYNADQMPPYELPANKTRSGIKSRSSLGGGTDNFNEIRFEDKKGSEEFYMHAEKDFNRIVENNDTHKIGFDKQSPGDQKVEIYNNRSVTLQQGNDALNVKKGNRTVKLDLGTITEEAMQAIVLKVGQSSIRIDQNGVTIKGMTISIQGQLQTEVKGLSTTVNGSASVTVQGGLVKIN